MSGRPLEADEAFSRAAIRALQEYPRHAEALVNGRSWLLRLTYNICMDLYRELKQERLRIADDLLLETEVEPVCLRPVNPEQFCLREEFTSYLDQCMGELPERLRVPMELVVHEEKSYREIADSLAISEVNVRKRIQQARSILRQRIRCYRSGNAGLRVTVSPTATVDEPAPQAAAELELEAYHPPWRIVALRPISIEIAGGAEREATLYLSYQPKRASGRRLDNLLAYVEEHPSGWKRRFELARHLVEQGHVAEALPHYEYAVERQPRFLQARLELAMGLELLGRTEEAIEVYRQAGAATPAAAVRSHLEGMIESCLRRWPAAATAFRDAAATAPSDPRHPLMLGHIRLQAGQWHQATAAFDAVLALDPEDPVALTLSHRALIGADRPAAARLRIERAVERAGSSFLAIGGLLDQRITAREVAGEQGQRSRYLLRQLRHLAPQRAATHGLSARYHLARGESEKARAVVAELVAARPRCARAWLAYAQVLLDLGRTAAAGEAVVKALVLDPDDVELARDGCRALHHAEDRALAGQLARQLAKRFPDDWEVISRVASILVAATPEQARELSQHALHCQSELPGAWFRHGRILARSDLPEQAIAAFEDGWTRLPSADGFPASTAAALCLAALYARRGAGRESAQWYATAFEHAGEAVAVDPSRAFAWRGRAREGLGQGADALIDYHRALEHFPDQLRWRRIEVAIRRVSVGR